MYIDPWGLPSNEEPADVILITHAHSDHFEPQDIEKIRQQKTQFVAPKDVAEKLQGNVKTVKPGDSGDVAGIKFQAVHAYSTVEHRLQTHPKSNNWVGYILSLDGRSYWFSGDTDPNPDIEKIKTDVALVCIGGDPYVMNVSEAAGVVKKVRPQLAVPNHYGFVVGQESDGDKFAREAAPVKVQLMKPVNEFQLTEAKAH
jgi:L-ascorbate metabolism protein UlaG (beta-lactamase superfamily)